MKSLLLQQLDRSSKARATSRRLRRTGWISGLISRARSIEATLRVNRTDSLQAHTRQLQKIAQNSPSSIDDSSLALAAACVIYAVRRALERPGWQRAAGGGSAR